MMDFVAAALPWIMMGLALAIYLANTGTRKAGDKKKDSGRMGFSLFVGILAGILVSMLGLIPLGMGLGLGALMGVVMGMSGR